MSTHSIVNLGVIKPSHPSENLVCFLKAEQDKLNQNQILKCEDVYRCSHRE